ncbi:MAG: F-type H+-transporting ATPase subunit b [Paracoccaceae bacterium]|jgi:F-type H+-transporting ATPase subunit b
MGLFFGIAHAAGAADGDAAHGAASGATGLPQLAIETFGSQIPWLVITLVVLFVILTKAALPKIGGVIEERHDAIEDDLDRAAEFKRRADEASKAYDQALIDARAEAMEIAAATRAEIQKDVDAAIAKADAEIAAKTAEGEARIAEIRAGALESVEQVAVDVAEALVAAIAPSAADSAAVKAGVSSRLGN